MLIVGCDFHTRFQQIAMVDTTTGEIVERRLEHKTGEAQKFYAGLPDPARIGMEATGSSPHRDGGHERRTMVRKNAP